MQPRMAKVFRLWAYSLSTGNFAKNADYLELKSDQSDKSSEDGGGFDLKQDYLELKRPPRNRPPP